MAHETTIDDAAALELVTVNASSSAKDLALLNQYFAMRRRAFPDNFYGDGPNENDLNPQDIEKSGNKDIVYIIGKQGDHVIGGCNYFPMEREPETLHGKKFPLKGSRPKPSELIPERYVKAIGLEPEKTTYIQIGGFAVDPEYQGKGFGGKIVQSTLNQAADNADFVIGTWSSKSLTSILNAAERSGVDYLVHEEGTILNEVGILAVPMAFTRHQGVFDAMKKDGMGVPGGDFIEEISTLKRSHDFKDTDIAPQDALRDALLKKPETQDGHAKMSKRKRARQKADQENNAGRTV